MQLLNYTIYSTPNCHYCHQLKLWLEASGVAYTNKDVALDIAARQEMVDKSQQMGVPVSVIELVDDITGAPMEQVVIGFDQPQISSLLGISA